MHVLIQLVLKLKVYHKYFTWLITKRAIERDSSFYS